MALAPSIQNILQFLSYIAPFLIGFLVITIAVANNEATKSLLYIAGAVIATFIALALRFTFFSYGDNAADNPLCGPFQLFPNIGSNTPSLGIVFMVYSFIYMLAPMLSYNTVSLPFLILMISLTLIGIVPKLSLKCVNVTNIFISSIIGGLIGFGSYLALSNNPDLLYFSGVRSNKTYCSKPDKTNFKCSVYKNGQLIQQL